MLSIIIPVYNAYQYLDQLIDCLVNQTYKDIEILLIDDGSTDGSGDLCDKRSLLDNRVKVFHKSNGGQSSARNFGLKKAKGKYIAFADHDDVIHSKMYESMIKLLEKHNADVCACQFMGVQSSEIESLCFDSENCTAREIEKKELIDDFFRPTWRIPVWNKVYRVDLVKDVQFKPYHLGEDNCFSYQIIKKCKKYLLCDNVFYYQRLHGFNYEFTAKEYQIDLLEAKEKILRDIRNTFPDNYSRSRQLFLYECVRIYNDYIEQGSSEKVCERIIRIIKRNSRAILFDAIPIGRKILFLKLKCGFVTKNTKKIIL